MTDDQAKTEALNEYRDNLIKTRKLEQENKEINEKSQQVKQEKKDVEAQINALRTVGQKIAEVYRPLENGRYIVKVDGGGGRFVVNARSRIDPELLKNGRRVALDKETYTIMHALPKTVDPQVYHMRTEDPGDIKYTDVGGLGDQLNEIREIIELPLVNPGIFKRVGIKAPKGALLYGPPGTGKTLIARAIANSTKASFLKVVSTSLIASYIGESAKLIREMFEYARIHQPTIIFIDEIDAIGAKRTFGDGLQGEREVQRTMLELLNQLDGFSSLDNVKVICATNRPDTLDPALMRSGRLDRKIELPMPKEDARCEILKIHSAKMRTSVEVNFRELARSTEDFNGAMLKAVCVEAGMVALRRNAEEISHDDYVEGIAQVQAKKRAILNYFA